MVMRFFLISGLDPLAERKDLWEKIERLLLNSAEKVQLQGMVQEIHFQDVGLVQEDNKLTLVKLTSDHVEHLDNLGEMELSSNASIKILPVQVTKRCQAKLDMDEIGLIPDLTKAMDFLIKNLGIGLFVENSEYWIAGELYQVAIAVKTLNKKYQQLPPVFHIEGSQEVTNSDIQDIQQFLNRKSWPKVSKIEHVKEQQVDLPYLVWTLCGNRELREPANCKLILQVDSCLNESVLKIASKSPESLAEFVKTFINNYFETRNNYVSVALDTSFPLDYKDLLQRFVTGQFKPVFTLENRKRRLTELVYHKEVAPRVKAYIDKYTKYNKPSGACNMTFFSDVKSLKSHDQQVNVPWRSQESGDADETKYCASDEDNPETIETYKLHRDLLQLKYFYLVEWDEFLKKTSYMEISLQYREGHLEMGTADPDKVLVITGIVEDMLDGISTEVIPEDQLKNYMTEEFYIIRRIDSSHVSITGHLNSEGPTSPEPNQSGAGSCDKQKLKLVAESKENKQHRRHRELLQPGDTPEKTSSLETD